MKAKIVTGLGYGDEGKGLTTDYLCQTTPNPVVVRFSGGQQAGHTVKRGEQEHTFSNFGAGSLQGITVYFSEHCTVYPVSIMKELNVLIQKGIKPKLVIHPLARVTTPYDVLSNRACSDTKEHGTCGLGIGKTHHRCNTSPYQVHAVDLLDPDTLAFKLEAIGRNYYPEQHEDDAYEKPLEKEAKLFMEAVLDLEWNIQGYGFLSNFETIIFEGSQGVLLDMDHGIFPNVTYSNTTCKNAVEICNILGISNDSMELFNVTRAYYSRHGNGLFNMEPVELQNNEDEHNVTNEYQGEFKVGKMDYDLLNHAIRINLSHYPGTRRTLVVTCNDHIVHDADKFDLTRINVTHHNFMITHSGKTEKVVYT